jgi:hypothetical protein
MLAMYGLLNPMDSCPIYSQGRSTLDHLVRFETFVGSTFGKREHAVSIFFDLEKVCDTTWIYGILRDLFNIGL